MRAVSTRRTAVPLVSRARSRSLAGEPPPAQLLAARVPMAADNGAVRAAVPVRSRAAFKAELDARTPPGEEHAVTRRAVEELVAAEEALRAAHAEEVRLKRALRERERKLGEHKAKFPRSALPAAAAAEWRLSPAPQRQWSAACAGGGGGAAHAVRAIGTLCEGGTCVRLGARYARALRGLDGFDKVWLVLDGMRLRLFDVVRVLEEAGVVAVRLVGGAAHGEDAAGACRVFDIKPYLAYCEAHGERVAPRHE